MRAGGIGFLVPFNAVQADSSIGTTRTPSNISNFYESSRSIYIVEDSIVADASPPRIEFATDFFDISRVWVELKAAERGKNSLSIVRGKASNVLLRALGDVDDPRHTRIHPTSHTLRDPSRSVRDRALVFLAQSMKR